MTDQATERTIPSKDGHLESRFGTPTIRAVLIHQPGKVGSSSMYESMLYSLPVPAYQTHVMNREHPALSDEGVKQFATDKSVPIHIQKARRFIHHFHRHGHPFACITLVRDPIARNVSAFFQNLDWYEGLGDMDNAPPVEQYIDVFLSEWQHEFADWWFDYHLRDALGPDWFAQDFDPEVGHTSFAHGKNIFMLMQLELPDETKERLVQEFLSFDGFRLDMNVNVGERKPYADIYRAFRERPLPSDYLDRMCESRIAKHFYTAQQVARFRAKWE